MSLLEYLIVLLCLSFPLVHSVGVQQTSNKPPSIGFGMAYVSIGMTEAEVNKIMAENGHHLKFLPDKQTALVVENDTPDSDEGQITFSDGRVVYAMFQFPIARESNELAQEVAGAIEAMNTKLCTIGNYSGHGTGGGYTESVFDCGDKKFDIFTQELLGSERATNVQIEIGKLGK